MGFWFKGIFVKTEYWEERGAHVVQARRFVAAAPTQRDR
jgi:hypothetical protein